MNRNDAVRTVLQTIETRSQKTRERYLIGIREMADASDSDRGQVGCSNLAHAAAGALEDQSKLLTVDGSRTKNLAIVTAYNDMLSAHQPYESYPVTLPAHQAADPNLVFLFELLQRLHFIYGTAVVWILGPRFVLGGEFVFPSLSPNFTRLQTVHLG